MLSQLSYRPVTFTNEPRSVAFDNNRRKMRRSSSLAYRATAHLSTWMVGVPGLEPGTSILSGWRSNQLSYTPDIQRTPCPLTCAAPSARLPGAASAFVGPVPRERGVPSPVLPAGDCVRALLPRKEVIQPHLPVRLPCYDFVPVARPTLGRCLHTRVWSAHGLQVFPTPMT